MKPVIMNLLTNDEATVFSAYNAPDEATAAVDSAELINRGVPHYYLILTGDRHKPYRRVNVGISQ